MIPKIKQLIHKGVRLPNPDSVEIGEEVDLERISEEGVVIHSGCKIFGSSTLILHGSKLGYQGPVTVENCCIGPQVELKGGYFKDSIFLKKSSIGPGAHVREGTILEEEANAAHTVGLKQTILFPYVTLGSLINFCDCLMSGGTSRKDHSEVGSSYIHFNYTPNQDKATPSLLGDVPNGVMLDRRPIFLGGQGGLVGPCRLTFGTVTAAGTICRQDELRPGRLVFGAAGQGGSIPYTPGLIQNIVRVVRNNIVYIANLIALLQWYDQIRSAFISDSFPKPLHEGLKQTLCLCVDERLKQLRRYSRMVDKYGRQPGNSVANHLHTQELSHRSADLESFFSNPLDRKGNLKIRDRFLHATYDKIDRYGKDYIGIIKELSDTEKQLGTRWLQGIVDDIVKGAINIIPSFDVKEN